MFKHYFERIENVEVWPVISLVIFFLFFAGLLIYVFMIDKNFIKKKFFVILYSFFLLNFFLFLGSIT